MLKFFWYLIMGSFYVGLILFVLISAVIGAGEIFRIHVFPAKEGVNWNQLGFVAFSLCVALFITTSYLHAFVRDNFLGGKEEQADGADRDDPQ